MTCDAASGRPGEGRDPYSPAWRVATIGVHPSQRHAVVMGPRVRGDDIESGCANWFPHGEEALRSQVYAGYACYGAVSNHEVHESRAPDAVRHVMPLR